MAASFFSDEPCSYRHFSFCQNVFYSTLIFASLQLMEHFDASTLAFSTSIYLLAENCSLQHHFCGGGRGCKLMLGYPIPFSTAPAKTLYLHKFKVFLVALQAVPTFSGEQMHKVIDI